MKAVDKSVYTFFVFIRLICLNVPHLLIGFFTCQLEQWSGTQVIQKGLLNTHKTTPSTRPTTRALKGEKLPFAGEPPSPHKTGIKCTKKMSPIK